MKVIMAAPDLPYESELVRISSSHRVNIVRRCVDASDLLAYAVTDPACVVVVSAGLPLLTRDVVSQLQHNSQALIGIGDSESIRTDLRQMPQWIAVEADAVSMAETISRELQAIESKSRISRVSEESVAKAPTRGRGAIIAVWGPHGAPGRTSVAIGLTDALAGRGHHVGLVDADTDASAVAFALGVIDRPPGLLGACRRVEHSSLDVDALSSCCRRIHDWSVMTGLDGARRGAHLRANSLDAVWEVCRLAFDFTVIDIAAGLESPEGGPWGDDHHVVSRSVVANADHIVVVADASALGAARLVGQWPDLITANPNASSTIIRNRVGKGSPRRWAEALREHGVTTAVHELAERRRDLEACWGAGQTPRESRQARRWSRSMSRLASEVVRH